MVILNIICKISCISKHKPKQSVPLTVGTKGTQKGSFTWNKFNYRTLYLTTYHSKLAFRPITRVNVSMWEILQIFQFWIQYFIVIFIYKTVDIIIICLVYSSTCYIKIWFLIKFFINKRISMLVIITILWLGGDVVVDNFGCYLSLYNNIYLPEYKNIL